MVLYLDELVQKITTRMDDAGFRALERNQNKAIQRNNMLANSFKLIGLYIGFRQLKDVIDAAVKMDSLNRSMEALAGSSKAGQEQIKFLREEAQRLGQDFLLTADSYKSLFAAGKGAGMTDTGIQNIFSAVMEASTVLGSSTQKTHSALLALEQMISKGKVSMEELRRQLGNALPGAMNIAARAMGKTSVQFQQMVKDGLLASDFVPKFAAQLRKEYHDKLPNAVGSLRAELARLNNEWFYFQASILEGEAGKGFAEMIRSITNLLASQQLQNAMKTINKGLSFIFKNIKLIIGLALGLWIKSAISSFLLMRMEILTSTYAIGSMRAALQLLLEGKIITGLKAIALAGARASLPFLGWALAIMAVVDAIETLQGKKTVLSTAVKSVGEQAKKSPITYDLLTSKKPLGGYAPAGTYALPTPIASPTTLPTLNVPPPKANNKSPLPTLNLTINAPNSQPETIAIAVKDVLSDFVSQAQLTMGVS